MDAKKLDELLELLTELRKKGVFIETCGAVAEDIVFGYNLSINEHEFFMNKVYSFIYADEFQRIDKD